MAALMRWALSQSPWLMGLAHHWEKACLENPSTRQVTATGILSAARSATSGNIILGGCRGRSRRSLGAGSRSPAPTAWCAFAAPGSRSATRGRRRHRRRWPGCLRETPSDLLLGLLALTGDRDYVTAELRWIWGRHTADPSSKDLVLAGKESTQPWTDPTGSTRVSASHVAAG